MAGQSTDQAACAGPELDCCFIGANVGGGWASKNYNDPLAVPPANILGSHTADGVIGGARSAATIRQAPGCLASRGAAEAANL